MPRSGPLANLPYSRNTTRVCLCTRWKVDLGCWASGQTVRNHGTPIYVRNPHEERSELRARRFGPQCGRCIGLASGKKSSVLCGQRMTGVLSSFFSSTDATLTNIARSRTHTTVHRRSSRPSRRSSSCPCVRQSRVRRRRRERARRGKALVNIRVQSHAELRYLAHSIEATDL